MALIQVNNAGAAGYPIIRAATASSELFLQHFSAMNEEGQFFGSVTRADCSRSAVMLVLSGRSSKKMTL